MKRTILCLALAGASIFAAYSQDAQALGATGIEPDAHAASPGLKAAYDEEFLRFGSSFWGGLRLLRGSLDSSAGIFMARELQDALKAEPASSKLFESSRTCTEIGTVLMVGGSILTVLAPSSYLLVDLLDPNDEWFYQSNITYYISFAGTLMYLASVPILNIGISDLCKAVDAYNRARMAALED